MKTRILCLIINRFLAPALFSAFLAGNVAKAALANFGDSSLWMLDPIYGSGVALNNVNNGNGFQVDFAAAARPGAVVPANYPTAMAAGYTSTFEVSGNFTIDLNFTLNVWPPGNGVQLGIGLMPFVETEREDSLYSSGNAYTFIAGPHFIVPTTDQSGALQLSRVGETLSGSYWDQTSRSWVSLGSVGGLSQDFQVELSAWTDRATFGHQAVELTMDNLDISAETILPGPYPIPYFEEPASGGGILAVPDQASTLSSLTLALAILLVALPKAQPRSLNAKAPPQNLNAVAS